jgi:hypothetical protein
MLLCCEVFLSRAIHDGVLLSLLHFLVRAEQR